MPRAKKQPQMEVLSETLGKPLEQSFLDDVEEGGPSFQEALDAQRAKEEALKQEALSEHESTDAEPHLSDDEHFEDDGTVPAYSETDLEAITLSITTLKGDIRTALLDQIRNLRCPWQQMPQDEQRAKAWDIEKVASHLVDSCLAIMNATPSAIQIIAKGSTMQRHEKGHIVGKFTVQEEAENAEQIFNLYGKKFRIVLYGDEETVKGERKSVDEETQSDQLDLVDQINY